MKVSECVWELDLLLGTYTSLFYPTNSLFFILSLSPWGGARLLWPDLIMLLPGHREEEDEIWHCVAALDLLVLPSCAQAKADRAV